MSGDDSSHDNLQQSSRRRILRLSAGTLLIGLAGCVGGNGNYGTTPTDTPTDGDDGNSNAGDTSGHTWIDDPFSELNTPGEGNSSGFEVSGRATLDPGFFTEIEVPSKLPSQINVSVSTEGGNMDVYLLDRGKFDQYVEGENIDLSDTLAVTNTNNVEETYQSEPHTYKLVFDNSSVYGSQPKASVQFGFEVSTTPSNPLIEETEPPEVVRSAEQPKIVEVRDNLGHTFTMEGGVLRPHPVDDEVKLSDDTVVKLSVTKIAAQSGDDISYSFDYLERGHRYNTNSFIPNSSWAWDLRREDYQDSIAFRLKLRNEDDIYYDGQATKSDDSVDIRYSNLTLDG